MVVRVTVGFAGRVVRAVGMLVVFVVDVDVGVVVRHLHMVVFVYVPLGQVQPDSDAHEASGQEKGPRGPVAEDQHRDCCPTNGAMVK